jgi:hypothetical protein
MAASIDPRQARINQLDDEIDEKRRELAREYSWFTAHGLRIREDEREQLETALLRERRERKAGK